MLAWGLFGSAVLLVWSAVTGRSPAGVITAVLTNKPIPDGTGLRLGNEIEGHGTFDPTSDQNRASVAAVALQQLGKPYQWGAEGPDRFDCSGLTQYSYKHGMGVDIPRTAALQAGKCVKYGPGGHPTDGDLVFLGVPAHHVGIYYRGQYINAPDVGQTVKVSPIPRGAYIGYYVA